MARMKGRNLALMGFMIIFLGWISWAEARTTTNIAKAADNAPDTGSPSGKFASFGPPALDDAGHVAFEAAITPAASGPGVDINQGIFLATKTPGVAYDPAKHLDKIVLNGDTAPGAGSFFGFDTLSVNVNQDTNKVQIAFWASVLRRDGITIDEGVYLYTAGALKKIAVTGDVALSDADPIANGNQTNMFGMFGTPVLNKKGQVAFWASLVDASGGDAGEGLFVDDNGTLKLVTMKNKTTPSGTGSVINPQFTLFAAPSLNNDGTVAFVGFYTSLGLTSHGAFLYSSSGGIYNSTGATNASTIATTGMATVSPWAAGIVTFVDFPSLNTSTGNRMVYWAQDNAAGSSTGLVINSSSGSQTIASSGTTFTSLTSFGSPANALTDLDAPSYNDAGFVAFWGINSGGSIATNGLVLRDPSGAGSYTTIAVYSAGVTLTNNVVSTFAAAGGTSPGTFSGPVLNNLKAVAFWSTLTVNSEGLFLDEDSGPDFILDTVNKGSRSQVVAPRRVRQGTTITVTVKIKNVGTLLDKPKVTRAVFVDANKSETLGATEVLTSSDDNDLSPGKSRVVKIRLKAPPVTTPQTVYVKVEADKGTTTTPELNETNNVGYSAAIQLR